MRWIGVTVGLAALAVTACTSAGGSLQPGRQPSPTAPGTLPAPIGIEPARPPAATPGTGETPVFTADVSPAEVPQELQAWVQSQRTQPQAAYKVVTRDGATYIAVTGGLKPTGGYSIGVLNQRVTGSGAQAKAALEVAVLPPAPGAIVTQALTNPVRYFKLTPQVAGTVQVTIQTAR